MKKIVMGILAHVDAGKTTLTEALLYKSGAIDRPGRVDNKDAFLDNYDIERARGITVFSKQAVIHYGDVEYTLIDTPGHVDFGAEMERSLMILDYAVLVIDGSRGVQSHTATLWRLLENYRIPTFVFVNKMDRNDTDRKAVLDGMAAELSDRIIDFTDGIPYEDVSLCDDSLFDEFMTHETIVSENIAKAVSRRLIFPCFMGSALKLDGIDNLMQCMSKLVIRPEYPDEFSGLVYKIAYGQRGERLTYIKITGGRLRVRDVIRGKHADGTSWEAKVNEIRVYNGGRYNSISEAEPGMVCAVGGLTESDTGDVFGQEQAVFEANLVPVITYKMILPEGADAREVYPEIARIGQANPELEVRFNNDSREINVKVMGPVQAEILINLVKERTGLEVSLGRGHIVYKETIDDTVMGSGHFEPLRHYAEVHLRLEPGARGSGMVFDTECSEEVLARNWQRLILTHLAERRHKGVLTRAAITDIKITLVSGRAHIKHTEGGDFRQAVYRAVRQGLMKAKSRLLEPYYRFRMELPNECVGRAMTDVMQMSGMAEPVENDGAITVLCGRAPVSGLMEYASVLMSYTHGKGKIEFVLDGYDYCHNESEVIEASGYDPESDTVNTADSVFCAHGAGYVVPWYEADAHMHVQDEETDFDIVIPDTYRPDVRGQIDLSIGTEEIDDIIAKSGGSNSAPKSSSHRGLYGKRTHTSSPVTRTYKGSAVRKPYLLVDGYNVIFAWKELNELAAQNIDSARDRLMDIMCNYKAAVSADVIVVFDAYRIKGHDTEHLDVNNIHVVYTREAQTADRYIEEFAHENGARYDITVVTSDGLEQIIIRGEGCRLISSREFEKEVKRVCDEHLRSYSDGSRESNRTYLGEWLNL